MVAVFGELLRRDRERAGLRIGQVAWLLGITRRSLGTRPSAEILPRRRRRMRRGRTTRRTKGASYPVKARTPEWRRQRAPRPGPALDDAGRTRARRRTR